MSQAVKGVGRMLLMVSMVSCEGGVRGADGIQAGRRMFRLLVAV